MTQVRFPRVRRAAEADVPAVARVHVDSWRSTYAGLVPDGSLARLTYQGRERLWRRAVDPQGNSALFVAEAKPEQIVGFANCGPERGDFADFQGELWAIYLLEAYQGQGIGRLLMGAVAAWLLASGIDNMVAWVLADNPARHFYAALSGRPIGEKAITIGGATLREIAFAWTDLAALQLSGREKQD